MFKYAVQLVLRRKLRTFLTSLGITVAVMLVSFIIFGMQGLKNILVEQFSTQFKPNEVIVSRYALSTTFGGATGTFDEDQKEASILSDELINELLERDDVEKIVPLLQIMGMQVTIKGFDKAYDGAILSGWDIDSENSYFVGFEGPKGAVTGGKVFISPAVAKYYKLDPEEAIGRRIVIEPSKTSYLQNKSKDLIGKKFEYEIIGVADPGQDRNDVILSISDGLDILVLTGGFDDEQDYLTNLGYDAAYITVKDGEIDSFEDDIEEKYGLTGFTSADLLSFLDTITQGLTVALIMFGLVSAVVASIGIVNTMIMSIYEQTREIGLIKAIGASDLQVLVIFLIQSGFIGLFGGVLGISAVIFNMTAFNGTIVEQLKGVGFANVTTFFTIDWTIAIGIVVISILVGVLAGVYPAIRAARLDPVKALRYE
jgi:ABC-type antimicrobial peptide transport system permease subunit